jgi:alanyl-tRNA synthetase
VRPLLEIFYDHGDHIPGGPPGSPDEDGDRFIEIWNNVFMQFNMDETGAVTPLPAPCVDTGMGLERLAAILQHVHSNYEIDIFDAADQGRWPRNRLHADLSNPSLKVIADHIRATAFLVSDGVMPSNEGPWLCAAPHRAPRHSPRLQAGPENPVFPQAGARPGACDGRGLPQPGGAIGQRITEVLRIEEERFYETLETGMEILEGALAGGVKVLPGDVAFKLHDTYGFPLDLSADVCRERGPGVDEDGFHAAMEPAKGQGPRGRQVQAWTRRWSTPAQAIQFVGYEH